MLTSLCRKGQRYNYYVAVALSLFLGMLGFDRFYLGYPAIGEAGGEEGARRGSDSLLPLYTGLVKLCTLGFVFIGQFLDFLLILLQVVGPADQSEYYVPFFGPVLETRTSAEPFLPVSNSTCA